jgi:hypothetical protein
MEARIDHEATKLVGWCTTCCEESVSGGVATIATLEIIGPSCPHMAVEYIEW